MAEAISRIAVDAIGRLFRVQGPASETDLNAKLGALISSHVELKSEHPAASFACASVIPDHTTVDYALVVEAKFIRKNTRPSKASEGMAADLTKYPSDVHILFLVYDPEHRIADDVTFCRDFESRGRCSVAILR
mgnify:CR=1 FL=1